MACRPSFRVQLSPGHTLGWGGAIQGHSHHAKPAAYSQGFGLAFKVPPWASAAGLAQRASVADGLPGWPWCRTLTEKSALSVFASPVPQASVSTLGSQGDLSPKPFSFPFSRNPPPRIIPRNSTSFWNHSPLLAHPSTRCPVLSAAVPLFSQCPIIAHLQCITSSPIGRSQD